jgi:ankyrin repeat protein
MVDVNTSQADGVTALHWAAHWNDPDIATLLIRAGANVNAANDLGVTPLSLACLNGSSAMVEMLLKAGANPNATMPSGETALMTCARTGSLDAVKSLLARGPDGQAKEKERGQTALMWAAAENHADVVKALVESGADVNARTKGGTESRGGEDAASKRPQTYLRSGIASAGYTPILFAARTGAMDAARVLLDRGAKVNDVASDGTTPLLIATHQGHWELAHFLLARGADPNLDGGAGFLPLHWASGAWWNGMYGAEGGKPERYKRRAALGPGKLELVKDLLAHGANPNARLVKVPPQVADAHLFMPAAGTTPIVLAAQAGDSGVMRALLEAGADPLLHDNKKTTPLMVAAGYGRNHPFNGTTEDGALEAAKLALEKGNDINAVNDAGETALHAAAYWGKDSMVQFLVDHGANVNAVNKIGQTPLTIAEGTQRPGNEFYSWPNLQVLLRKLGGVSPAAEIEGPIAIFVAGSVCPEPRMALGRPVDYSGGLAPGYTEFVVSVHADTEYTNGGCADLKIGVKIKVKGTRDINGDGSVVAKQIRIEQEKATVASANKTGASTEVR